MIRRLTVLILLSGALIWARSVTVAAAANLGDAIRELRAAFEADHPGTTIRTIIASSGKLTAQIRHGAPYELFLSADMDYPRALKRSGEAVTEPAVYARGALALFSVRDRNLSRGLEILKDPEIHRIAIANPRTAPYGKAAKEALEHAGLWERVRPRLIYGQSVGQSVLYALKAADMGLIAKSALFGPRLRRFRRGYNWIEVDPALYRPIDQGLVLLRRGASDPEARAFYRFLLSPRAQKIFRRYGYLLP